MKQLLKLEEIAQMAAAFIFIYMIAPAYAWWLYPILFFLPDLSIAGYAFSSKTGAIVYNLFHHKAIAILMIALGWIMIVPDLTVLGLLFFSHSAFDRALGYGLKYGENFHHTHLGIIGPIQKG